MKSRGRTNEFGQSGGGSTVRQGITVVVSPERLVRVGEIEDRREMSAALIGGMR